MSRLRSVLSSVWPTLLAMVVLGVGLYAGRWATLFELRRHINVSVEAYTLGRIVPKDPERSARASAYYDPDEVKRDMDEYSWAVPTSPTPFVGCAPRPGKNNNATINSLGMRSDKEVAMPKPEGVFRIFLTGGSTAYGAGAPSQDRTIAGYLERLLSDEIAPVTKRRYEVFVMATPSWVSTQERIAIENKLIDLSPDLVLAFSGNNDVHFGRQGKSTMSLRTYPDQHYWELVNLAYKKAGPGPIAETADHRDKPLDHAETAKNLEKNIRLAAFALSTVGARYVFALQPTLAVSTKELSEREKKIREAAPEVTSYFAGGYAALREKLKTIQIDGFTYLDLSDVFKGRPASEEIFIDSYHFGDRGNEAIARALLAGLRPMLVPPEAAVPVAGPPP